LDRLNALNDTADEESDTAENYGYASAEPSEVVFVFAEFPGIAVIRVALGEGEGPS
jgi:hypothetical protein